MAATAALQAPAPLQAPAQEAAPAPLQAPAMEGCAACGAPFAPDAAFCLRCGSRRGSSAQLSARSGPYPNGPPVGPNGANPIAYAPGPAPYDQVAPASGAPQWYQQNACMPPAGQGQFPWPNHMMAPPHGAAPWQGGPPGGEWAAYMPADQGMAPNSPRFMQQQCLSPRFMQQQQPSPRLVPELAMGAGVGEMPGSGGQGEVCGPDSRKESLLPCRPCRWSCKRRCLRPCLTRCNGCSARFGKGRSASAAKCAAAGRCLRRTPNTACRPCIDSSVVQTGRWKQWVVIAIGLASIGSLLAALLDETPHLLAAGLSAALGWLACYAYMLQRDCLHLARGLESDLSRHFGGEAKKEGDAAPGDAMAQMAGIDLDVTGLARSLGSPFCNTLGTVTPGKGKSGQTMQAVLTSALVNEYLRCASSLQKYQNRHGILPNAPQCNPGFAEALLTGLHGMAATPRGGTSPPRSSCVTEADPGSPAASNKGGVHKGTPNFADRLAAATSELGPQPLVDRNNSPVLVRNNPYAESQKAAAGSSSSSQEGSAAGAIAAAEAALSDISDVLAQGANLETQSVPPPPSASWDSIHTNYDATGAPFSFATSPEAAMQGSPESVRPSGPAPRSSARHEDLDSSLNDPPWLRAIRKT